MNEYKTEREDRWSKQLVEYKDIMEQRRRDRPELFVCSGLIQIIILGFVIYLLLSCFLGRL